MATPDEIRRRAQVLEDERRASMAERRFAQPDPDEHLLATLPNGGTGEIRLAWVTKRDRAPSFGMRLWVDEGAGSFPVRGVGVNIAWYHMVDFARAVADALELAIEEQKRVRDGNRWRQR